MGTIKTAQDIKQLGTILCVGAHPDDETWIAGGIMAAAAANGQRVVVITATQGEAGTTDESRWPAKELAGIRAQELHTALAVLGVTEHGWLGCLDGECDCLDIGDMALRLAKIIHEVQPDSIITFGPEGLTGHADHSAVSDWCTQAVELTDVKPDIYHAVHTHDWFERWGKQLHEQTDIFFNIDEPPLVDAAQLAIDFELPADLCAKKLQALQAQASQMEELLSQFEPGKLPAALCQETFIKL